MASNGSSSIHNSRSAPKSVAVSSVTDSFVERLDADGCDWTVPTIYGRQEETRLLWRVFETMIQQEQQRSQQISDITAVSYKADETGGDHTFTAMKTTTTTEGEATPGDATSSESFSETRIVIVHGESGSGKTSLVELLRQPVMDAKGFFCSSKYFQINHTNHEKEVDEHDDAASNKNHNDGHTKINRQATTTHEPYSAIMAAFSDLCELVQQSDDFTAERRDAIIRTLGADGILLAKSITPLSHWIVTPDGDNNNSNSNVTDEDDSFLRNESAFAKFKFACKSFLRALSSHAHPIVLFLDDIQWMDAGSRQLLHMLLADTELRNVMFILAYRDEDHESVADFITGLDTILNHVDIQLGGLNADEIYQLISAALSTDSDAVRELSDLVAEKTCGNPLHVKQFFDALVVEKMIIYNSMSCAWVFDVERIRQEMMVTNSLANLLIRKVNRLPSDVQEILKLASLFGFHFQEEYLLECFQYQDSEDLDVSIGQESLDSGSAQATSFLLNQAVKGKFIEKTKAGYQFSHDKIQSTFRAMISREQEDKFHLMIGLMFLRQGIIDNAATHLNDAPEFIEDDLQRIRLARLDLEASRLCRAKFAFDEAAEFLRRGLALLDPETKWIDHFDLAFEMTESLAKMDLIAGNLDECRQMTAEALKRSKNVQMKTNALLINVEACMVENRMDESVAASSRALQILGIQMPRKIRPHHVFLKILTVKRMLGKKSDDEILAMPRMTDKSKSTAVKLLLHMCLYCLLRDELDQGAYAALLATQLTLQHGLSPYAANAFTIYGIVELTLKNHARAYRFHVLSMKMLQTIKCKDAECSAIMGLTSLAHWREPLRTLERPMLHALQCGFEVGDVVYGSFCAANCFALGIMLGDNLHSLELFMRDTYRGMRDLSEGADSILLSMQAPLQFVVNLKCHATSWEEVIQLTGEIMDEATYCQQAEEAKHSTLKVVAWTYKLILANYFCYYEVAETLSKAMAHEVFHDTFGVLFSFFFSAMAAYARYRETGRSVHRRSARKYKKGLARIESVGSPNARPLLIFLEAEELSSSQSLNEASVIDAYGKAIVALSSERLIHLEALANERAAYELANLGCLPRAARCFLRAMALYKLWGATAKCDWLEEQRHLFMVENSGTDMPVTTSVVGSFIHISSGSGG